MNGIKGKKNTRSIENSWIKKEMFIMNSWRKKGNRLLSIGDKWIMKGSNSWTIIRNPNKNRKV